jgi:long-chain acyl-CoA synthetase
LAVNTLPEMLATVAQAHAGRPAVVTREAAITYGELLARVRGLAADLGRQGVRPGDRVGLLLPNGPEFVLAYFAATTAGAVVVPMNEQYQQTELLYFLDECGVSVLIAAQGFKELVEAVLPNCQRPCRALWAEEWTATTAAAPAADLPQVDPHSPAMHQFSSGSTGRPKRISRTHANLMFELGSLRQSLGSGPEDRFIGVAPFSHVNGLTRSMLSSLRAGAALYPIPKYDRQVVAETIEHERITVFIAVPFMFSTLAQTHFRQPPDFSSLRLCVSASAPMPRKFNPLFREKFGQFVRQLYGSTETGTISVNLLPDVSDTLESVGTPIAGVRVEVFLDDGQPAAPGEMGEFAIASPAAITAYDGLPEANRESFRNGYFFIGDLGRKEADGTLYLVGRKKFFINKGGFKIDPREIEELLEGHPQVLEAAVVGVPSPYGDERVKAVLVTNGPCAEADIVAYCRGRIADFKIPSQIEFRDSLPKSPTGKIRRAMLK